MKDGPLILIAEDCVEDKFFITRAFEQAKVQDPLYTVGDGDEVIAYLKGEGCFSNWEEYPLPALLLLDVQMPGKSGFEVLQWIRNEPCLSTLRVIVLTGSVNKGDIKLAYKLGANSVLVKPTSFTCLTNMIQTLHKYWLSLSPAPEITRPGRS